jgi:undecaprenyl-diphosphatase
VAAGLLELKELLEVGLKGEAMTSLIVGLVVSAIVSWLSIAWLTKYLQQHSTWVFVGYRLIFGAAILYLATNHLIS